MEVSHTYSNFGIYAVTLTITTDCGVNKLKLEDCIKVKSAFVNKEVGKGYTYTTIQEAINDAVNGEVVLVHDGIYRENINFQGKAITLRSENGSDHTIIDGNSIDNVIIFNHNEDRGTILDGFTIQNGSAYTGGGIYCSASSPIIINCLIIENKNKNNYFIGGGGISCYNASPMITNCIITKNTAPYGGGIYCRGSSSPMITGCTISNDSAGDGGGGIYCYSSSPTIISCIISHNMADIADSGNMADDGGGIYCTWSSSPVITDCIIINNKANDGGGISCDNSSSPKINNCTISNNTASYGGGGIVCAAFSSPLISSCTITDNTSAHGGGIYSQYNSSPMIIRCKISSNIACYGDGGGVGCYSSSPTIINCIISSNTTTGSGGGINCSSSSSAIINCTITANIATNGGGINGYSSHPKIINCILWGNMGSDSPEIDLYAGSVTITHSDIKMDSDVHPGPGNINADPLFVENRQGNYSLKPSSPCIDSGDASEAPSEDQLGIRRPIAFGIDMGAYEYVDSNSCIPRASFTANHVSGNSPLVIDFDSSSSGGGKYPGATFTWDFGDGKTGSGVVVSHNYTDYGVVDVSLTVNTECGSHEFKLDNLVTIKSSQVTKEVGKGKYYSTIQAAIDEAVHGEVIQVQAGTYLENINFKGKAITVRSQNGANNTIIDGGTKGSVVIFDHAEDNNSILDGFTIQNGAALKGGGIYCMYSSPHITNCIIRDKIAEDGGGGVFMAMNLPQ